MSLLIASDTCLVRIARRNCNRESTCKQYTDTQPPVGVLGDVTVPSNAAETPCQSHYLKAMEAYGAILNSIGCICKVLLSLNLDSCCFDPRGDTFQFERTTSSTSRDLHGDSTNASTNDLYRQLKDIKRSRHELDCGMDACCSEASLTHAKKSATSGLKCGDANNKPNCCVGEPRTRIHEYDGAFDCKPRDSCKTDFGIKPVQFTTPNDDHNPFVGCGRDVISCCTDKSDLVVHPLTPKEDPANEYCDYNASEPAIRQTTKEVYGDSSKGCCVNERARAERTSHIGPVSDPLDSLADTIKLRGTHSTGNNESDLEKGEFSVEHVVLSVQGMTCTGCEKKLLKSLDMIPGVSKVKTSLLMAQAEFDITRTSAGIDACNIIKTLEKMTGFSFTKMMQSGHELDLIVDGPAMDLTTKDLPFGVSNIVLLEKHTIRVSYHPKLIGARELMVNPYFRSPKLAPMADRPLITSGRLHVHRLLFRSIVSTVLTVPVLVMAWAPLPEHAVLYGAVSLVLATIVQVYIAGPWYLSAFSALLYSRLIEMDLLIVLSTTTAYVYSIIAYAFLVAEKPLSTESYFQTSTLLVTLITVGSLVTSFARQRAVESISIESLQSSTAFLIVPETHEEQEIDARLLQYQDIFKVLPETSVVTDGTVIAGTSEVDESMITGEATLVPKSPGSPIVAGSINHSGILTVRLSLLPGENTIKAIGLMVDEAKSSKTKIQEIADRVASYFVPVIFVITVLVFVVWVAVGKVIRDYDSTTTCITAMTYAISALIVSCPCAIGLAVPMVLVVAGGVAAKHGVIYKSAETIEIARNLSHVIFDKTGTLTQGSLAVEAEIYPTEQGNKLGPMLLGLTNNSKHPVSNAIATYLKSSGVQPQKVEKLVSVPGCGMEASWDGSIVRAGNPYWLGVADLPCVREILLLGFSIFCVLVDGELVAVFGLKDLLRPDAIQVVNELQKRSIEVSIVSGDNRESVRSVASALSIPESHVRFRCSPVDKQMYVKQMLISSKSVVMFCGDGTNDAVALAQASIGLHIHGGTDIAASAADAVLMRPALSGIIILMDLSKAVARRVVFNFLWSFIYNTFAILLAAGAFPGARIPPEYAALGEIVSVLPVVAIGMQLKWAKFH